MSCQAPRKPSNQEKLMLGTTVGTKTITQMRFHTASTHTRHPLSCSECRKATSTTNARFRICPTRE